MTRNQGRESAPLLGFLDDSGQPTATRASRLRTFYGATTRPAGSPIGLEG
jgi:hypothetical protein